MSVCDLCLCDPYSRVRSRYCPAGLVMRAGRDTRGASPPPDWPIRPLFRRETDSKGLWTGERNQSSVEKKVDGTRTERHMVIIPV